jgi:hypothetical protein
MSELSESDAAALTAYGGEAMLPYFRQAFEIGRVCIVVRSDAGRLAVVCWAERVASFKPWTEEAGIFVSRCFTLPEFRGLGLYPAALRGMDRLLPNDLAALGNMFIECSVFNDASRSGILKAGFRRSGITAQLARRRVGWRTKA